jgi:uncharacterized protein (TIGR00255 family)
LSNFCGNLKGRRELKKNIKIRGIMKSMTGFGLSRLQISDCQIEVSLRCVNGRFLETRFHLPRAYFQMESDLKKKLNEIIKRGTVDIYISRRSRPGSASGSIVINTGLAQEYLKSFRKLAKDLKINESIRFDLISRQPDVVVAEEPDQLSSQELQAVRKAFDLALKKCDTERAREGLALKKDLLKNVKELFKFIQKIHKLRDEANKQLQEKYESKFKLRFPKEMAMGSIEPQRIAQEILIQIDKADINEELIRLNEHIKNFERILESDTIEGKKLDFYTQELLREVNTIGSKSQLSGITESVVESKTLIERLREQIQNVE